MARISPASDAELAAVDDLIGPVREMAGFVPNSYLTLARRPEILRSFAVLAGSIMGPGQVPAELKSLVSFVASTAAGCRFCQAHTSHTAHRMKVSPEKIAAAFEYESSPLFSPAERAALALAADAGSVPNAVTDGHFDALREHFSEPEILELVAVISLFGFLNRWNDTLATQLEDAPLDFASKHLEPLGWSAGKHAGG